MKILTIVPPTRPDYYDYLLQFKDIDWVLIWFEHSSKMPANLPESALQFREILYWNDYKTPSKLLEKVKPDRILFFEIIDLRQIALIVSASHAGIPTYFSDHGAAADRDATVRFVQSHTFKRNTWPYLVERLRNDLANVIRSKYFYFSVRKGFKTIGSYMKYLSLPFKMLFKSAHAVLLQTKFKERIPLVPIIFNQPNYEDFESYTGARKEEVFFSGVPFFDNYYAEQPLSDDYLVYIDHPYYEDSLAGWTRAHHENIANQLFKFAEKNKVLLYIKLHPRSNKTIWDGYRFNEKYIKILQNGDFRDLYLKAKLIFGYSSSLINGFLCAKKNVVILGWNPDPHIEGADFSKTGLCHSSMHIEDLNTKYSYWVQHNLAVENEANYQAFLKKV